MTSSPAINFRLRQRNGFTLIELLVSVTIIIIVIGITLPVLLRARRSATRTRIALDLQVIAQGLEEYRKDFKDYPPVDMSVNNPVTILGTEKDRLGAVALCWALVAPGPAISTPAPPSAAPLTISGDGADGPGFRIRGTQGQTYGPYIPPDKFGITGTSNLDSTINDVRGTPYLYFRANPVASINAAGAFVGQTPLAPTPATVVPMYDYSQNSIKTNNPFLLVDMQRILGDTTSTASPGVPDGAIDPTLGETPATTAPYLLWSAGSDELWGYDSNGKTDDVTNFNQ